MTTEIGVISDTHGLVRPEAIDALAGSELILHAGDIGKPDVLEKLRSIAPVIAVRGNNDKGEWVEAIPERETIQIESVSIHLLHIIQELSIVPQSVGIHLIISGHSHKPLIQERDGVLYLNPGSAGPRRFKLPVSIAQLRICDRQVEAEIIELSV